MKKFTLVLFVFVAHFTQAFSGKIQFLNYANDSITGFLLQPKNQFQFDTIKTTSKIILNGFELAYELEKPVIAFVSVSGMNYGPFYVANGTLKTQLFTTSNAYSEFNRSFVSQYHYFFEGQNVAENKAIFKMNEMLKSYFEFTFKIEDNSRDSIFITKEKYFAKLDSLAKEVKTILNTTAIKDNALIKNTYSAYVDNYTACYKLSYLTYKKYYDRTYDWRSEGKNEIAFFNKLKVMDADPNYYFGLQCMEYLYDTSAYFQWDKLTSVVDYSYEAEAEEVTYEEYAELSPDDVASEPISEDWYTADYKKRVASIRNLNNKGQEEVMISRALADFIDTYFANYYYMTTADAKVAYEETFDKTLNDYLKSYNNKEVYAFLENKLREQKALALEPVTDDYYGEEDYVADTAETYEETNSYFPNLAFLDDKGKEFNLPLTANKKFIVVKIRSYYEEKDFVYLQFLEKKYKKVAFYYVLESTNEVVQFKKYKLKGKILTMDVNGEQWSTFFNNQYYSCFKIYADYTFESGGEQDIQFLVE